MRLSIILPVRNESENIGPLLLELSQALRAYPDSEVIAVDDGSTDDSLTVLRKAASEYPFLRVVELARNYGQTAAIAAGMELAQGDVILPMDADGQNDPADIPKILEKLTPTIDIVSGWRSRRKDAWLRSQLSLVANRLIRSVSGQEIHDYGCTMKAYRRSVIEGIGLYGDMHRFLAAYAAMQGARIAEVHTNHRPRLRGRSKYGFDRVWRVLLDVIMLWFFLKSMTRPMQFFGGIGLLSIAGGFLTILGAFGWKEAGGPTFIETPLPVLAALLVIIGVQCVLMGVLAEVSMRTYFQTQRRTPYRVRSIFPARA